VAHCYALVKTSTRGTAQGLPAAKLLAPLIKPLPSR
jgi:hypothetical protein